MPQNMARAVSLPGVPAHVELHLAVVPEALSADVALERSLSGVEPDMNLEPVAVRVLAGAEAADQR